MYISAPSHTDSEEEVPVRKYVLDNVVMLVWAGFSSSQRAYQSCLRQLMSPKGHCRDNFRVLNPHQNEIKNLHFIFHHSYRKKHVYI